MYMLQIKKDPNFDNNHIFLSFDFSIEKLILNLLNDINIKPIYLTNDFNLFCSCLFANEYELESRYKPIIDSLLNFNKSSLYIINKQNIIYKYAPNEWKKSNNNNKISVYLEYLKFIIEICCYICSRCVNIGKYQANILIEKLQDNLFNKLNKIKNNVNLGEISLIILKIYKETNPDRIDLYDALKIWIKNYINKDEDLKEYDKLINEQKNIFSFFKYLQLICTILNRFINLLDRYDNYKEDIKDIPYNFKYNFNYNKTITKDETIKAYVIK